MHGVLYFAAYTDSHVKLQHQAASLKHSRPILSPGCWKPATALKGNMSHMLSYTAAVLRPHHPSADGVQGSVTAENISALSLLA